MNDFDVYFAINLQFVSICQKSCVYYATNNFTALKPISTILTRLLCSLDHQYLIGIAVFPLSQSAVILVVFVVEYDIFVICAASGLTWKQQC